MQACTRLAGLVLAFAVCLCAAPSAALECGAREDAELASHRRIGWQDFQATPPARPGRSGGAEVVVAQIRLLVRVDALSVRTEQRADGTWVARGVPCVRAYLVKRRSGRLPSARFAWQLSHEQRHFDLAQVYAQRLRDRVLGLELAGRTEAEAERGLRAAAGRAHRELSLAHARAQRRYDRETNHGRRRVPHARWFAELREGDGAHSPTLVARAASPR